jgi:serine/threonine-protein kinase
MLDFVTGTNGQTPAGVQDQLEKVLASEAFRNAPRLSEFLRFSVGAALRGEAGQIKEYLIGVEVFPRGPDYDPRIDPVVRVEARRLRAKLREYYEQEGRQDALRIHFPKGGYAPVFESRETAPSTAGSKAWRRLPSRRSLLLAAGGAAAAAVVYLFDGSRTGSPSRIAVLPMRAYAPTDSEDVQRLADGIVEAILRDLSAHQDLSVVSWPTAAGYRAAGKGVPEISRELGAARLAAVWVRRYPERLVVSVHVVDGAADRKLWAEAYELPPETQVAPAELPHKISSQLLERLRTGTE